MIYARGVRRYAHGCFLLVPCMMVGFHAVYIFVCVVVTVMRVGCVVVRVFFSSVHMFLIDALRVCAMCILLCVCFFEMSRTFVCASVCCHVTHPQFLHDVSLCVQFIVHVA